MERKSYYYSQKLTASETQQIFELPRLRGFYVNNTGPYDIQIELENDIDDNSIILLVGQSIDIKADMLDLRYKSIGVGSSAILYVAGLRHEKA